ncbi:MAG: tRNA 4-thiouridine(8) synthase ThiI [Oscillospiraceae bacterium]|nr:tRNA 4-thiouridine(8) synthase ThiI [Oscillospiraceae bacterium]
MKEIILIKDGEIALKGLNRRQFEDRLIKNIKGAIKDLGQFEIKSAQSTIYITPLNDSIDLDDVCDRVSRVFGIAAFSRAVVCPEKNLESVLETAPVYLADTLKNIKTFKVEAKRSDKKFPYKSPEICRETGGAILKAFPHLKVDVHNPDLVVNVEIRDFGAYVRGGAIRGAGGIPVGTGGNAAILISGGIDSPVAAYMMAKRGVRLTAIHFASPPYTSPRAEQKVVKLLKKVARYSGDMTMYTVPFTEIQETIKNKCPEELFTIIMRRLMMEISQRIAEKRDCSALITGESLGQVASQTIHAIGCTDAATTLPVFRPLIGMDKQEIIDISYKIDTFKTSIEPYEDCCTVFTPKHPRTRPVLKYVEQAQEEANFGPMIETALENLKVTFINPRED